MKTETTLDTLRAKICAESDVKCLHKLIERDGVFYYLIETPFASFPKAVVGETNADFTTVRHLCEADTIQGATSHWDDYICAPEGKKTKPEKIAAIKELVETRGSSNLPFDVDTVRINRAIDICDLNFNGSFFSAYTYFSDMIRAAYKAADRELDTDDALYLGAEAGKLIYARELAANRLRHIAA